MAININKIVTEEVNKMIAEAKEKAPLIEKDLEKLRKKFFPEMMKREDKLTDQPRLEKRVAMATVSELLDTPVSELMLYFLNGPKLNNERSLIEYHSGQIYFYAF